MPRGLGRGLGALIPTGPARGDGGAATGGTDIGATDGATALHPVPQQADAVDRWLMGGRVEDLAPDRGSRFGAEGAGVAAPPVPRGTDTAGAGVLRSLPTDSIVANRRQPRTEFDAEALAELVASIREVGLLQPVVVRPTADPGVHELVMGERRWRASREAGLRVVPAIVRDTEDGVMLRDALLENLHRADLNPLEEAAAYQQLLDDAGCSQEELSHRIGRSRPQISNTLRLLRLAPAVQRRVAAGVLSAGHARALVALGSAAAQEALATRIVAEGLSVRATEEIAGAGGGDAAPGRRAARTGVVPTAGHEEHDQTAQLLGDLLETRVTVGTSRSRGRIVIDFATTEDLRRIRDLITEGRRPLR